MRVNDLPQQAPATEALPHSSWIDGLLYGWSRRSPIEEARDERRLRTRIAALPDERAAAEELVRRRYAWRGYRLALSEERDCAGGRTGEHWVTLLAEAGGRLLGTLTVGPDGRHGLLAAGTYAEEIDRLRDEGRRLGELTRLAIEKGADWKGALDALVQATWLVTRVVHALTDVLIEVNPRHVSFYQRVFGFEAIGSGRVCPRVGAPSVLLLLDLEAFGHRLKRSGIAR
jgi:hypothetical protein